MFICNTKKKLLHSALVALLFNFFVLETKGQLVVKMVAVQNPLLDANVTSTVNFSGTNQVKLGQNMVVTGGKSPYTFKWTKGGTTVSTDTFLTVVPNKNDVYTLTIIDSKSCTVSKDITLTSSLGTGDLDKETVNIYPVPAKDYLRIEWKTQDELIEGQLFNTSGIVVWEGVIDPKTEIPLHFPPGYYLLKLKSAGLTIEKRIIIL